MKRLLDAIITVIILAIIVSALLEMIKPYAMYIVIALGIMLLGGVVYRRQRYW